MRRNEGRMILIGGIYDYLVVVNLASLLNNRYTDLSYQIDANSDVEIGTG